MRPRLRPRRDPVAGWRPGRRRLGVAAIGAGVFFGLQARSIEDEAAGWDVFDPGRFSDGEAAQRLGHKAGREAGPKVTLVPSVTSTAVTLGAAWRF